MGDCVARGQGLAQVIERHAEAGHALRVQFDVDDLLRAADGVDIPGARYPLDLRLQRVSHFFQFLGAAFRVLGPERRGNDGHVVDALGLHDGWQDAEILRPPVLVGEDRVVQPHECLGARLADLELHGEHAHARAGHRVHVFHPVDLREHLLHR